MSIISKTSVKATFETGDIPTQSDFVDLIDSTTVPNTSSLTYASTITTDASTGDIFRVTLTGGVTLANPTNTPDGKVISWEITQGTGAPHAITLGTKFVIPSNATLPLAWSTALNKMDILAVRYNATADKFYVISLVGGY